MNIFLDIAPSLDKLASVVRLLLVMALILTPLEYFFPANRQALLRHKGAALDLAYWFFTPLFTQVVSNYLVLGTILGLFYIAGTAVDLSLNEGRGAIGAQPIWLQSVEILILADFVDYWTHRTFHSSKLWRFHAIHHSPEEMNWLSSSRMHPINDVLTRSLQILPLVLLGFSAAAVTAVVPYVVFYVIFLHSNLKWSFGPFRYVLVSPAYHRWHHSSEPEAIDKNFAGVFPIWDLLFGTCHLPAKLPRRYGVSREHIPDTLGGQLLYPFCYRSRGGRRQGEDASRGARDA